MSTHRGGADGTGVGGPQVSDFSGQGHTWETKQHRESHRSRHPLSPMCPLPGQPGGWNKRRAGVCGGGGLNPLSSPQGTWIIKGLFLLLNILVIPRWDGSASPLPSGPAEHPAGDGTWAEMAASRGLMRANEGHTCRPRSKPGNPGTQTWPRLALSGPGPSLLGTPAPPRVASSCPSPYISRPKG